MRKLFHDEKINPGFKPGIRFDENSCLSSFTAEKYDAGNNKLLVFAFYSTSNAAFIKYAHISEKNKVHRLPHRHG